MNKDLDERLLPEGEYRDASNIQISSTEANDAGTVQNILGNRYANCTLDSTGKACNTNPTTYTNTYGIGGTCVGMAENTETEKIYLFIKGTSVDAIVEFNEQTTLSVPVLVEDRSRTNPVLQFDKKITGITIIQDFLIWTDNTTEPKIVDISDSSLFKSGSLDSNGKAQYTATTQINSANFIESDVALIRKKPIHAPKVQYIFYELLPSSYYYIAPDKDRIYKNKFVRFAYRWKFDNGQYSAYSPFSNPVFLPDDQQLYDFEEGFNSSMVNMLYGAKLMNVEYGGAPIEALKDDFQTVNNIKYVDILYKESNNQNVYLYKRMSKADVEAAFATGISVNSPSKKSVIPNDQLLRAYDNVPLKAKALDVVGNRLIFGNYIDGLNLEGYTPEFNVTLHDRLNINTEPTRKHLSAAGAAVAASTTANIKDLATVKSGREYQIGVVFEDEYGRQSPVLTSASGHRKIDFHSGKTLTTVQGSDQVIDNDRGKKFNVKNTNAVPLAAYKNEDTNEEIGSGRIKRFKYYIKSSSNNYNNIAVEQVQKDLEDSSTIWLVVPSYEVNKIQEGQYLQLKKGLNTQTPLTGIDGLLTWGYYDAETFKVKALSISKNKPENIAGAETFDGKFFIKIKANTQVLTHVLNNQGLAGATGEILEADFKQVSTPPAYAMYLGETPEPHEDRYFSYYFSNGQIYEVAKYIPDGYTVQQVYANGSFSDTQNGSSYAILIGSSSTYNNSNRILGSQPHLDSTGTVEKVEVKFNSAAFPTHFKITYTNSGTAADGTPAVFETVPLEEEVLDVYYEVPQSFPIDSWSASAGHDLDFYNAFTMRNGVESSVIADDFNEDRISNGVKVSTITPQEYTEKKQPSSLIYSGIFNSDSNINKLNEFNQGLKITKELNPEYGSIQKLHTRNTDLIALCEDKILRILANKDALFNADGNVNLTASANVLGQAVAFNGDYGISKNPESFANYGYRSYFTDKARGVVLRLSRDGLTVISDKGMATYFRERLLDENDEIRGSYDIYSDQYVLTLPTTNVSLSFKEDVDGWVSRLQFVPDRGVSLNGKYFTCYNGELYLHHADGELRNTFYGSFGPSEIKTILNLEPSTVKNFKNISYEGTPGWTVGSDEITTDQQDGQILEFKEKEGKYFGLISGINEEVTDLPTTEHESKIKDFSIQGLGVLTSHTGTDTFACANAGLTIASGAVGGTVSGTVSAGTIKSYSPATYSSGTNFYTATIEAPTGYGNSGSNITCSASAGATATTFTCATANLQIADGTTGATVTGTVSAGSIASISPATYTNGTAIYTATINIGSGYSNSGTLTCTGTATGTLGSCGFTLATNGTYSSGGTTLTGTFSGTDYTNSDAIALTVSSGTISPTTTTKSALAGGLAVTLSEGVTITATVTSGLCSQEPATATVNAPQSTSVVINGPGTAFTYQDITLTASTTGTITSYQWHKDSSSGFTLSSSTAIEGATNATLITSETGTGAEYYVVRINDSANSAQHTVTYSDRPSTALKFLAGSSISQGACGSGTTRTVFHNNASFTASTEFYEDKTTSVVGFLQGTYSNSSNGSNNHHRFISSQGIPGTAISCAAGSQGVKATKCNDSSFERKFNIDLDGNATLANGAVVSFTAQQFSNDYWVISDASYAGTNFDASPTFSSTHSSCTAVLTPVIDVTPNLTTSFVNEGGSAKTVTLSAATRSNEPQGITPTFQWKVGTASNSLSNISGATSETFNAAFATVTIASGATQYYNCTVTYTDGSDTKNIVDSATAQITWNNFPTYTDLNYVNSGSASSPASTACTDTSNQVTLYGDNLTSIATTTQFYNALTGTTSVSAGTYSNGSVYAYVNNTGGVESAWSSCNAYSITGAATASSFASNVLTASQSGFSGTNFVWTAGGTQVQSGASNTYTATVANTFSGDVTYACTVSGGTTPGSGITNPAQKTVTWSIPNQKVTAQLCPSGATYHFNITNSSGFTNGQVLNLTGSGFTDGCYKVTNQSYSGNVDYSAEMAGNYPFQPSSTCCDCVGCSVTISGVGAKEINTSTTLTAAASGFTATNYAWYSRTTTSGSWGSAIQSSNSASLAITGSLIPSSAGSVYYKVVATASGISKEDEHTISWFANNPIERWYTAQSYQSDCTDDDEVITVRYTSVDALSNGTVFELGTTVVTCYKITGSGSGNSSMDEIQTFHNSCTACQNANSVDCSFSLSSSGSYNSSNGTDTITGTFGSGHTGTVSVGFSVSSGTVSPGSATKSDLESGVALTLSGGVTLTGTINSSDSCAGDSATVTIPQSTCNSVQAYNTTSNPATNSSAANDLCNPSGSSKALYINGTTLSNSTQVYTANGCGTLMSGTKYYSTDNSTYFIWNGSSLAGPYTINCP